MEPTFEIIKLAAKDCLKRWKPLLIISVFIHLGLSILVNLMEYLSGCSYEDAVLYITKAVFYSPLVQNDFAPQKLLSVFIAILIFLIQHGLISICTTLPVILLLHRQNGGGKELFLHDWRRFAGPFFRFALLWGCLKSLFEIVGLFYQSIIFLKRSAPGSTYSDLLISVSLLLICILLVLLPIGLFVFEMTPVIIVTEKRNACRAMQKSYLLLAQKFFSNFWQFFKIAVIFFVPTLILNGIVQYLPFHSVISAAVAGAVEPLKLASYLILYRSFTSQRIMKLRPRLQKLADKLK